MRDSTSASNGPEALGPRERAQREKELEIELARALIGELEAFARKTASTREAKEFVKRHPQLLDGSLRGETYALFRAAQAGNAELVRALVKAGAPVNQTRPGQGTPLMAACRVGATGAIEELVRLGAQIAPAWEESTQRMRGLGDDASKEAVIEALLSAGADIDAQDEDGETALSRALGRSSINARPIVFLTRRGANPNQRVGWESALRTLAERGAKSWNFGDFEGAALALLEAGADPLAIGSDGKSVADLARDPESEIYQKSPLVAMIVAWAERQEISSEARAGPAAKKGRGL